MIYGSTVQCTVYIPLSVSESILYLAVLYSVHTSLGEWKYIISGSTSSVIVYVWYLKLSMSTTEGKSIWHPLHMMPCAVLITRVENAAIFISFGTTTCYVTSKWSTFICNLYHKNVQPYCFLLDLPALERLLGPEMNQTAGGQNVNQQGNDDISSTGFLLSFN